MTSLQRFKTIGNIGAGTMGHATALQFALHGYTVNLLDTSQEALDHGLQLIKNDLKTFQENDLLTDDPAIILARIHLTTDYQQALHTADFVIESVVEDLAVKRQVWQHVEQVVPQDTLLATNTSGLSPSAIQRVLTHPDRFVVAHFWNPAQLMPLVEVVPGEQTAPATVTTTVALMTAIGKHAVPLKKESLGFVGNRIQLAVLREALHIVQEGIATPSAVDDIVKYSLGRRWSLVGPLASADLSGLDVFNNISRYLYADLANETDADPTLARQVAAHQLGLKTGQGLFDWTGDRGQAIVAQRDQQLLTLLKRDHQQDETR
ncbi:3-hydroxyacyl-CoA dehydrogenase family protein [Levilactobacillus suantsaii]|uniref:L-gulonate 3-dehydrogenase n=1 Tax=Levilactobacillus suantsaii TaxID=2292255 RepID=A0A4Q0VJE3_9LACO|nr:3-hydroxyacyl-CoA dehydrogenase family protein [Levilactobacillus suantsaii]QMU07376.1 3-hydroxyacyl-CoA dehydrogenase family protein [Levilactobacillus suantsaii]RXI79180.1 3-hydroxyacyl-CoA dehydrogenase family protein [Levilactobacillus suantsaii]